MAGYPSREPGLQGKGSKSVNVMDTDSGLVTSLTQLVWNGSENPRKDRDWAILIYSETLRYNG